MSETHETRKPVIPCTEVLEFLWAYVSGELPPGQSTEFERHFATCDSCVAYLDSYRKTVELTRNACPADDLADPPEDLVQAILASRKQA
ncbi:MAG TPA: zf-HC2 domain-containing protein [Thermoanaerobaculia bacterium]